MKRIQAKVILGDTENFTINIKDAGDIPMNLTGATGKVTIDTKIQFQKDLLITNPETGVVFFRIHGDDWLKFPDAGQFKFDVQLTLENGDILTVILGTLDVADDVTK